MALRTLIVLAALASASAMCPNACSGHGSCGAYDMCTCYTGWQSNDCSLRTCGYGFSFVTTPQGDLNLDGDRYDNTQKLLVKQVGGTANTGNIDETDNILTLSTAIQTSELVAGDAIRISDETFVITAVSSTTKFSLDHDRQTTIATGTNVYKYLETIAAPQGTWESWVGDYNADDEGHYYMECSNRGKCDRSTGICECFDGYSGSKCQRQRCPNDCSGHGTCETVTELAAVNGTLLSSFTAQATAGSMTITPSANPTTDLAVGDTFRLGSRTAEQLTVAAIASATITVTEAPSQDSPFGTRAYKSNAYDLWDAAMDRACVCDNSFTGADCALRSCPHGDDPLTVYNTPMTGFIKGTTYATTAAARLDHGTASYSQRNEKQNIYLDTMRGSLTGSFTLTFTDAFGQAWTTDDIDVSARLTSKAYIGTTKTVVTFNPALPYGDLVVGDFIMIGDERQEVSAVTPDASSSATKRPIKLGGVIDSVTVRNAFAASIDYGAHAFRASPARGIEAALEGLPNGVVPGVTVNDFNTGTLFGYCGSGVKTVSSVTYCHGIKGDYDQMVGVRAGDANDALWHGTTYADSTADSNGGLAPYDMVRLVGASGYSEFVQVKNVDQQHSTGINVAFQGKGTVTTVTAANSGIGAGKHAAIYKAGGYHVRVSFDSNSGDLPEMEVDTSGLFSVFFREFTGTVTAAAPRAVVALTHGGDEIATPTAYPVPSVSGTDGINSNFEVPNGGVSTQTYRGESYDLKLMAGMKVKLGDQVRTVVTDIADVAGTATFFVDQPFTENDVSEVVNNIEYIFYRYPVAQLYDQAAYDSLTLSRSVYMNNAMEIYARSKYPATLAKAETGNVAVIAAGSSTGANRALKPEWYALCSASGGTAGAATYCTDSYLQVAFAGANTASKHVIGTADLTSVIAVGSIVYYFEGTSDSTTGVGTGHYAIQEIAFATNNKIVFGTVADPTTALTPTNTQNGASSYIRIYFDSAATAAATGKGHTANTIFMNWAYTDLTSTMTAGVHTLSKIYGEATQWATVAGQGLRWACRDDPGTTGLTDAGTCTAYATKHLEFTTQIGRGNKGTEDPAGMSDNTANVLEADVNVIFHDATDGQTFQDAHLTWPDRSIHATATTATSSAAKGCVCRTYSPLISLATSNMPPLHKNNKARWAIVTDQRPLTWNHARRDQAAKSSIGYSVSRVALRGVFAGDHSAMTLAVDGSVQILTTSSSGTVSTLSGSGTQPSFLDFFGFSTGAGQTVTTRAIYLTVAGCSANSGYNGEQQVNTLTATAFTRLNGATYAFNGAGVTSGSHAAAVTFTTDASICVGNTVTFSTRVGTLSDSKAVALGDRVRFQGGSGDYEYRTVDKLWGTGLDITTFSVVDAFDSTTSLNRAALDAWIDEAGSTEEIECSRRGLCDQSTGLCGCFAGYTGNSCGVQNAMAA